jgi:predicted enzyme related to lactoylglutathione lyase
VVQGPHDDEGHWTTVLADPEGNEFCVIVSPEDR